MRASAVRGMDEITCETPIRSSRPPEATVTATAAPFSTWTAVAAVSIRRIPPRASTWSAHRSHIIPGPNLGYSNSSMRLVTCLDGSRRRPATDVRMGSHTAFHRDIPLMRWAPQSADISEADTAHSFSL